MSGVEALAVISIIASIVTLIEFSRDAVYQIKEYSHKTHEVPKAFRDIRAMLPLLSSTLARTHDQVKSGTLDDDTCKALRPVLEGCENKLKQLKVVFNNLVAEEGASRFKRGLMTIKSMRKDKEVKEITQALDRFVAHLTHYHASEGVTTKGLESLKAAVSSMSVKQPEARSSKAHFLVPVQWSDDFAGREDVMEFLESRLCLEDRHSRVALVGLGGMGKTRIALEYAKKFKTSDQISVFWVYAGTTERFKHAYQKIARKLRIPGYQSPESSILRLVKDWLEDHGSGRWLMILDNADNAEIMYGSQSVRLADYFPKSEQGSILLTTRFQRVGASFASSGNVKLLEQMTLEESELLLRARLGDEFPGQNRHLYQELATELERTPLALVQAAAFMSQNCIPLASYIHMYRESDVAKIRLLSENFEDDIRDSEATNPIATTWIISFDYIRTHIPQAAELLSLMSIMDAQNIPDFLIPQVVDAVTYNEAIGTLVAFGFISTKKESPGSLHHYRLYDLHRLVRLAIRNWLIIDNTLDQRTAQVLKILAWKCNEDSSDTFGIRSLILPHAIELFASDFLQLGTSSNHTFENKNPAKPSLSDLYSMSKTSSQTGEVNGALEDVDTYSNLVMDAAHLLNYVTFCFRLVGNYVEAKAFAAKSLELNVLIYGESQVNALQCMSRLATILKRLGEYEDAEQLLRRSVTICELEYGNQHILTVQHLLELKLCLSRSNRDEEAKEIGEIAVQRCQKSLLLHEGEEHLNILSRLAEIQLENGDSEEAEQSALLALNGHRAANNDFEIIRILYILSRVQESQNRLKLALDIKEKEIDMSIRHNGQNHSWTMSARLELTRLLLEVHEVDQARRQASLSLEFFSQIYGSSSDTYSYQHGRYDRLFSRCGELLSPQE